ncbi:MAG: hypothetical protein M3437_06770 [Chloroflexota bacterium]|nr:hypothetical protein [Chloroflexota bacterium]MDQ5866281.1 hypothetical protein [Chloroflexota bacterium]
MRRSHRVRAEGLCRYMMVGLVVAGLSAGVAPGGLAANAAPAQQQVSFADPAFQRVWERTDAPVANGSTRRSFYWGPAPISGALQEEYVQGPGGKHLVQYFDKGRMEINNPNGNRADPFYVTPGRLTLELMSGYVQLGNDKSVFRYPANIPVAGDTDDNTAPTYASSGFISSVVDRYGEDKTGQVVIAVHTRNEGFGENRGFQQYNVKNAHFEPVTRHNIPDVFWSFLNAQGPIMLNGRQVQARLSDPYFYATGYPITEPFWSYVKINGRRGTEVLIQLYERRVLTYVPSAPEGFKVQMGNIGQHYYDWRYKDAGRPRPIACKDAPAVPANSMGRLWTQNTMLQTQMFCPMTVPGAKFIAQRFERGLMVFTDYSGLPDYSLPRRITVLYEDGTTEYVQDPFDPNAPQPTPETAPQGLYAPVFGFGKVWREQANVRQRLGWARAPEQTLNPGEYLTFRGGWMLRLSGEIYAHSMLYNQWYVFDEAAIR